MSRPAAVAADARLRAYLARHRLGPGDALPPESALAAALRVGRNTLRETLSRWRQVGAVTTRRRRGMVLASPDPFAGLDQWLDAALLDAGTCRDLYEFRLVLEVGLADLLVRRVTEADLVRLREIVAEEQAGTGDPARFRAADAAFHSELYRIAGNRALQRFQGVLARFFDSALYQGVIRQDPYGDRPGHRELLAALADRDAAALRERMAAHLRIHLDHRPEPA